MLFITYSYHILKFLYKYIFAIWDLPATGKYTNCDFAHLNKVYSL